MMHSCWAQSLVCVIDVLALQVFIQLCYYVFPSTWVAVEYTVHTHRSIPRSSSNLTCCDHLQSNAGIVNITNSFAVPFEEDDKDPKIWFLDHNYLENMFAMFKKVNGENISTQMILVGWRRCFPCTISCKFVRTKKMNIIDENWHALEFCWAFVLYLTNSARKDCRMVQHGTKN